MSTQEQIRALGRRWATAETQGDTDTLDLITTEDFTLIGPLGFVLTKSEWLQRYRADALVTQALTWDDTTIREYGDTAVVVGRHSQRATYAGNPVDDTYRATHIVVRRNEEWLLAGIHLSRIAMPARKAELNHTIVHARDKTVSATFLARILDLPVGESAVAHFLPVVLTNGVTLDFMDVDSVQSQHYAFLISPDAFDAAFARIKDSGVEHWADPGHLRPNEVNHYNGGKGVYFADPDGHNMELLTKA